MTATMACRGMDGGGTWVGQHAAVGHRRLIVIDPSGGRQPMTVETADGPVVLVYSGEVYNYGQLRAELMRHGHEFRTRSDTEVVLRGYLHWGRDLPTRLRGMYAFAIWDGRNRTLVMVRDRLAVKPLYYAATADGVLFGSEPKAIFASGLVERRMGLSGFREIISGVKTPGHGIWEDMQEVRPGTMLTVDPTGIRTQTYWRLQTRPHTHNLERTIEETAALLEEAVAEQLVADVPVSVLLSGGLDSSAITALAARREAREGRTVRTFTVDYTGHSEHFAGQVVQRDVDTPFAHQVRAMARTDHRDIVLESELLADRAVWDRVISARDLPIMNGDVDASLLLFCEQIKEFSTVALSGEAADEIFGGYSQFFDPDSRRAYAWPWVVHFPWEIDAALSILTPEFRTELDLERYLSDTYATAIAPLEPAEGGSELEYDMRRMNYLHVVHHAQLLLDRKDRLSMAAGVEIRVPYCDHRLVEYVYNVPWKYKAYRRREKDILRSAVDLLLPTSVLERAKSGYPATPHPAYLQALQRRAVDLVNDVAHPVFGLIRRDWLSAASTQPVAELTVMDRQGLQRTLCLAQWLDLYRPSIC